MFKIFKYLIIFYALASIATAQDIELGKKPEKLPIQTSQLSNKSEDPEVLVSCIEAPAPTITLKVIGTLLNTYVISTPLHFSLINNRSKELALAATVVNGTVVVATALVAFIMIKTDNHRFAKIAAPIYFFSITLGHIMGLIGTWAYMDSFGQAPQNEGARVMAITFNSLSSLVGLVFAANLLYNPLIYFNNIKNPK